MIYLGCNQGSKGEKGDTGHGGFNGMAAIDHGGFPGGFMDGPPGPPGPPGKQVGCRSQYSSTVIISCDECFIAVNISRMDFVTLNAKSF